MFSDFLIDFYVICNKSGIQGEELERLKSFTIANCDKPTAKADAEITQTFRKLKNAGLFSEYRKILSTPKSWDTDFDGENGIPPQ